MKATSIFGGVQVINIIISIIRSKVIAVLLGPAGIGIIGLLQTTISLVTSATNFGLGRSAIRDIANASGAADSEILEETVSVFKKLVWVTGILGMILMAGFSPVLSKVTFGNYDYTIAFLAVSVTLLLTQISTGYTVILQGLRKIKWVAKANVYGSILGLICTVPLYYFFRENGIAPAIIISAIIVLFTNYIYVKRVDIQTKAVTLKDTLSKGRGMLKMGFMLSLSSLLGVSASYLIRIFISNTGSLADVGFFSAGFSIIGTYVGLVFAAMSTDYYPRLSAIQSKIFEVNALIKQQSEIALFILVPLICVFLIYIDWITILLYSKKFLPISSMVHWAMLGIFFKAVSWSIAIIFLAKGDSKSFFWNELAANLYTLLFNCLGYYFLGLEGLGISFLLSYFLYLIQVYWVCAVKYKVSLDREFWRIFTLLLFLILTCFGISLVFKGLSLYILGTIIIIISFAVCLFLLNKKMGLASLLRKKYN